MAFRPSFMAASPLAETKERNEPPKQRFEDLDPATGAAVIGALESFAVPLTDRSFTPMTGSVVARKTSLAMPDFTLWSDFIDLRHDLAIRQDDVRFDLSPHGSTFSSTLTTSCLPILMVCLASRSWTMTISSDCSTIRILLVLRFLLEFGMDSVNGQRLDEPVEINFVEGLRMFAGNRMNASRGVSRSESFGEDAVDPQQKRKSLG